MRKLGVVAIGPVPPPVTGQAIMVRMMVQAPYRAVTISHVPMMLSDEVAGMGSFSIRKVTRVLKIPLQAIFQRFRHGADVLYYPPAGPVRLAVLRDIFILVLTRPFFARTVLHFHAGGLSEIYPTLSPPLQWLYRVALKHVDVIVRISPSSPSEMEHLEGKHEMLVPNGIPDPASGFVRTPAREGPTHLLPTHLLFVGHLSEGKGVLVLLEAVALLLQAGHDVRLTCIGRWSSEEVRERSEALIAAHSMADHVSFPGGLTGEAKWACFREADIFCFPSFYHSEVFPLVLLEAMAYALPVVTTRWRGIPDVVAEGENALLVATEDAEAFALAVAQLIADPETRARFGQASRQRFLANFLADVHLAAMEQVFLRAAAN